MSMPTVYSQDPSPRPDKRACALLRCVLHYFGDLCGYWTHNRVVSVLITISISS